MTWQRFSDVFRKSIVLAQEEARKLGCPYVSTEHLLLGMVQVDGPGADILSRAGLSPERIRREIERELGDAEGEEVLQESQVTQLTPLLEQVYKAAANHAARESASDISTLHLLRALLEQEDGVAARVLARHGIDAGSLRQDIEERLEDREEEA